MAYELHEKCAVVGVAYDERAAGLGAAALSAQSHRGAGATGLGGYAAADTLHLERTPGDASEVYTDEVTERLLRLGLTAIVGHDRYATFGPVDAHFQPVERHNVLLAHNGTLPDTDRLNKFLYRYNVPYETLNDSERMGYAIGELVHLGARLPEAINEIFPMLTGAFSCVALSKSDGRAPELAAFRDRYGVRPLVLGTTPGGAYIFASETCGLAAAKAAYLRDVQPGELVVINENGLQSYELAKRTPAFDAFELIYFARPDSEMFGQPVGMVRHELGKQLAVEYGHMAPEGSLVVGVPASAWPFAQGFADARGLEHQEVIHKNPQAGRSFMQPTQKEREALRNRKYVFDEAAITGRDIVLIDDSIVRMTTAGYITRRLYDAGARSVVVLVGSPPIRFPNFYGIDTPEQRELAAAHRSIKQMRDEIGCQALGFLSLDGMTATIQRVTGQDAGALELSCFTGSYPIPIGEHNEQRIFAPVSKAYAA